MLYDLWERYRRWILICAALAFAGVSYWIYLAQQNPAQAGSPFHEVAAASESVISPDAQTAASPIAFEPLQKNGTTPEMGSRTENTQHQNPSPAASGNASSDASGRAGTSSPPLLYVDVKGKVRNPGLYALEPGSRVADAIEKAGGSLPEADVERINLAESLTDGSAILIPSKGTASACAEQDIASAVTSSIPSPASAPASGGKAPSAAVKGVNINTASLEELMTLPGVGESRAKAIMEYRAKKGGFRSPDELKQISGIGAKIYERMKDQIRIQ
ncbi:helix-hairpin-helix domain-containing protein [Brevibacillus borstelensis]|uniref:helix-hairpin-helix domain-containing protein n=1 Tax=Brevibacillus borstelensis TaxID=45462 RepID=UPI0030BF0888